MNQLNILFRHNERKNTTYSNKDINKNSSKLNYSIKPCNTPYSKIFNQLRNDYNLKGKIKNISNVACEYIITASPEFFDGLSNNEIKRFFETSYKFVCSFKNLGEQYIISAKVHMDESTPHMHLVYLPVVHTVDKTGTSIDKLCCSDFWKGKNSYKVLQDNFYKYLTKAGFDLERGNSENNEHIKIEDLKRLTNYELQKYEKETIKLEHEIDTQNIDILKQDYRRVIKKFNTLAKQYTKIKVISDTNIKNYEESKEKNKLLENENKKLKHIINSLKNYINKSFYCVSLLFNFPLGNLKNIINTFVKNSNNNLEK